MRTEIARMLSGKEFWMSVALCAAAALFGTAWPGFTEPLEPGHFLDMERNALCSKAVCFLLPVTAVLPWSDSVLTEWKGGFLKSSLPRQNRRVYTENKVLAVALGGLLAWIAAGMAVSFLFFVLFFPLERTGPVPASMLRETAAVLLRCGLVSGILGTMGGICAVLSESSYLAFGIPFVGYYFCIILRERYFPHALWIYPPEWILGGSGWGEGQEGLWYFLSVFLVTSMGIHGYILYGKLEEL